MQKLKEVHLDLLIMLALTVCALILTFTTDYSNIFIRTISVITMTLFVPGYLLMAALFPGKNDIEFIERVALSFGLSLSAAPLIGLPLKFVLGITSLSILLPLHIFIISTFALALIFIAGYRRGELNEEERFYISFDRVYDILSPVIYLPKSRKEIISNLILIFLIVFSISALYFVITTPKTGERFTEFYILDSAGKADNYTTELKYYFPAEILVGVVNHEYSAINYTVQVALEGEVLTDTWFSLDHNETWEKNVTFIPDKIGTDMRLEFWLFKEDNFTVPYRDLYLFVSVKK